MSYNVLADKWAIYKEDDPMTHKLKFRYGFLPDDKKDSILNWNNRLNKILNKISDINPDIICLQEVELKYIHENFINNLPNYDNIHHTIWKKEDNKNLYKRTNDIGNVTFWKKDIIKCLTEPKDAHNSCAVFTELLHLDTNFKFLIINVHLLAGLFDGIDTRTKQILSCLKKIKNDVPTCICGDFNEELNDASPNKIIFDKHNFTISPKQITCNVYSHDLQNTFYYAFDHIVSNKLDITVDTLPTNKIQIPNETEPSDHRALTFTILIHQYHAII